MAPDNCPESVCLALHLGVGRQIEMDGAPESRGDRRHGWIVTIGHTADPDIRSNIGQGDIEWGGFVGAGDQSVALKGATRARRARTDRDIMGGPLPAVSAGRQDNHSERDENEGFSRHSKTLTTVGQGASVFVLHIRWSGSDSACP